MHIYHSNIVGGYYYSKHSNIVKYYYNKMHFETIFYFIMRFRMAFTSTKLNFQYHYS